MPWICRVCSHSNDDQDQVCMVCEQDKRPFSHSSVGKNLFAIIAVPITLCLYAAAMVPSMYYTVRMFRVDELLPYCALVGVAIMVLAMVYVYGFMMLREHRPFLCRTLGWPIGLAGTFLLLLAVPSLSVLGIVLCAASLLGVLTFCIIRMLRQGFRSGILLAGVAVVNALLLGMALSV